MKVEDEKVKFNSLSDLNLNSETGEWNFVEKNNWILNPSFDADSVFQEIMAGWINYGTGNSNSNKSARIGNFCMQQYSEDNFKGTLSQDVTFPNGIYTLKG